MHTLTCVICNKQFQSRWPQGKICPECKNRPCVICGKPLKKDAPPEQKCCCAACSKEYNKRPEVIAAREAKKKETVKERYGVDNVTYLQSTKDKAHQTKSAKAEKRKAEKLAIKQQERAKKLAEKEAVKIEKEKAKIRSKLRSCKKCGKLFVPTSGRNYYCKRDHHEQCKVCGSDYIIKYADLPYPRNVCYDPKCAAKWRKRRNIEIYGTPDPGNLPENIEKRKQTNLEKYGVDNPFKSADVKEKAKATNMAKYGVPYACQSPEVKAKQVNSLLEHWGEGLPELVKRRSQTCLKKYGVSNPRKLPEVTEKIKETCMERYGMSYPPTSLESMQSNIAQHKARVKGAISKTNRHFKERLDAVGWDCQFEFEIEGKFYDIWNIDHPILIEIDPTYTHYTDGIQVDRAIEPTPADYHSIKSELASKYGFQCVHIFDWDDKFKIVQMLRRDRDVIYARKCKVVEIDNQTASEFESVYHLQGSVNNQAVCLGLDYNGELVEVMTFGKPRYNKNYQVELLRLCTHSDYTVVGGASKLFHYFIKTYDPDSIISYCDRAKFSGEVYKKLGMTLHHVSSPAKVWSKGSRYITDNLLRQRGFDQLFGTSYGKGTSNEELMVKDGWRSVYDCGQFVFEWKRKEEL